MKSLLALVMFGSAIVGSIAFAAPEEFSFAVNTVKSLDFEGMSGNVRIIKTSTDTALVSAEKINFPEGCRMTVELTGTELDVKIDARDSFGNPNCEVNFAITVPEEIEIEVDAANSNLEIVGIKGPVEYNITRGSVNIDGQISKLEGSMGSGNSTIKGLTGNADIKTLTGDVNVTYKAAEIGNLDIKSGSGNTNVFLPLNTQVLTVINSASGSISNEFSDTMGAKFKLSYRAGLGDLNIKRAR